MEEEIKQLKMAVANLATIVEDNRKLIGENMRDITDLMKQIDKLSEAKNN